MGTAWNKLCEEQIEKGKRYRVYYERGNRNYCKNTRDKIKSKTVRNCRYTEETATSDVYRQEGDL